MIAPVPTPLEGYGVRLEPLTSAHEEALVAAASDGRLWELWFTSVPAPDETGAYIATALSGQQAGHMLPWAVRELSTNAIVGSTRYHDMVPARRHGGQLGDVQHPARGVARREAAPGHAPGSPPRRWELTDNGRRPES